MKLRTVVKFLLSSLIVVGLLLPLPAAALEGFRVHVEYLDNSKFPQVSAYVSVSDSNGLPIKDLKQDAFVLTENGTPVAIQSFQAVQNTEQPLSITLLMDTSMSMLGTPDSPTMQKAIEAAVSFVSQLSPKDQVAVIKFSNTPETVLPLTEDKTRVIQAIQSLHPEGQQTALYDALIEGVNSFESRSGRKIMVLITDGKNKGGTFKADYVMQALKDASIPLYPIGFGGVISVDELKNMATITGGSAKILPSVFDLSKSFDDILKDLREQYLIRYVSSFPADNTEKQLLVTVNYGGGQQSESYAFITKTSAIPVSLPDLAANQEVCGMVYFSPVIDWAAELIKGVEISVDGSPISAIASTSPEGKPVYGWNAFAAGIKPGAHEFIVKVTDVAGNTGQTKVTLDVQPPIEVEITSPKDGDSRSGKTQIVAKVTTRSCAVINRVSFLVDNQEITSIPGDPAKTEYKADWDTGEARPHPVKVIVYDTTGLFTTEAKGISVNVEPGGFGGVVVIVVLAFAALVIPLALRSRRRRGTAAGGVRAAAGNPSLRELEGANPGQVWQLGAAEIKLGRKRDENDVLLKGLNASRRHAVIRFEQGQYFIYSLSAENPVLVNDAPITQKQALKRGDIIRLGETVLQFS